MLIALALQAAAVPQPSARDTFADRGWARFERAPLLQNSSDTVEVAFTPVSARSRTMVYTMRLTRRRFSRQDTILWASSVACPAMRPVLQAMQALSPPHAAVPGMERGTVYAVTIDGTAYRLSSSARFADGRVASLDFGSNTGTPLAAWVDRSLAALERCWSPSEPDQHR